jgi:ssDNA-binding Zn-finger/Zn-ribbon topoisomerase 1
VDGDGGIGFKDLKMAVSAKKHNTIMDDAMEGLDEITNGKEVKESRGCIECGATLGSRKTKYNLRICVKCYRNPSNEVRCVAESNKGMRCKRRYSPKSESHYCGIHMRKYETDLI